MNSKFLMFPLVIAVSLSIAGILNAGKKPEEQSGYDKSKDVGLKAPKGAEVLFDGSMTSVKMNWEMWPKKDGTQVKCGGGVQTRSRQVLQEAIAAGGSTLRRRTQVHDACAV